MSRSNQFKWWQKAVIYQIYPRSFKDSNADGIGDLQGIIDKLDYLNDGTEDSLGIDAIWISPIYPSPMADFGYDVSNYVDIEPMFGDLATFDRLVEAAHRRNIRIILDFVPNHSSDEHPWFIESRCSRDNPKRDWYIWKDAKPDGRPPNNWGSAFGGSAWEWDESTQQYYLHIHHVKQPDLNWRNPEVVAAMQDVLRFWLNRGVDGFRVDVAGIMIKDEYFRDNPLLPDLANKHDAMLYDQQEHLYDQDRPEVHDTLRDIRHLVDTYPDRVLIGEVWYQPRHRWTAYYGENLDEFYLPTNFELMNQPWDAAAMQASVDELETIVPKSAWPNYVLGSHDAPRLASRYGVDAVRLAAMMLLTLRGTPIIYMGEEIGMQNGVIAVDKLQDPIALNGNPERGRDHCRTPFQWSTEPFAGFSPIEPWLPISDTYHEINADIQTSDEDSILSLYRQLLHYREKHSSLNSGSYKPINDTPQDCFVYLRENSEEQHLIVLNFSDIQHNLTLKSIAESGDIVLSTHLDNEGFVELSSLSLRPYEGLLIKL